MLNDVSMTKWNVYIIATVVALGQNCAHILRSIHVILIWLLLDLCETLYDEVLRNNVKRGQRLRPYMIII